MLTQEEIETILEEYISIEFVGGLHPPVIAGISEAARAIAHELEVAQKQFEMERSEE